MRGFNKSTILGNVTADPELRYTNSGTAVVNITVATNDSYTSSSGERVETTEFHRVVAWAKLAEIVGQFVRKGDGVFVEGPVKTSSWEDSDGVTRYTREITAREFRFAGSSSGSTAGGSDTSEPEPELEEALPF